MIAGAGIIGLSLALELHARGQSVLVVDAAESLRGASVSAAGMLAADDPHNPAALREFARYSLSLYPGYLERLTRLGGCEVPFQTCATIQYQDDGTKTRLKEHSLDPRQLAASTLGAFRGLEAEGSAPALRLLENAGAYQVCESDRGIQIRFDSGEVVRANALIHAQGAWFGESIAPRKGQMLRVRLPEELSGLDEVHRRADVYVVPRTMGPQAGTALIGATIEDAGFDTTTQADDLDGLRAKAAELLPALADQRRAPTVEAWAGLRPYTADGLPLVGALTAHQFVASGHFRNGILLAPATAVALADLIEGRAASVDLRPFDPRRFRTS